MFGRRRISLINQTLRLYAVWLIPLLLFSIISSYFIIQFISRSETDIALKYEMDRIVNKWEEDRVLPSGMSVDIVEADQSFVYYYTDTLILKKKSAEFVPYRKIHFCLCDEESSRYLRVSITDMLYGKTSIIKGAIVLSSSFIILLLAGIFLLNSVVKRIWYPFYKTLTVLNAFSVRDPSVISFPRSNVKEFEELNYYLQLLLDQVKRDFRNSKEFNENASHELQTHLATIRNSLELLINQCQEDTLAIYEIENANKAVVRLSNTMRSLLLLSKIGNNEFDQRQNISLNELLDELLVPFTELTQLRVIKLEKISDNPLWVYVDKGLAEILLTNLIKNAIMHNHEQGFIQVTIQGYQLIITNSGANYIAPQEAFQRFKMGKSGNTGIGLSLVKHICDMENIDIQYTIVDQAHCMTLDFANLQTALKSY